MTRRSHLAVVCSEPLRTRATADDVIALALSVIRGRVFSRRSVEVQMIVLLLRKCGYEIVSRD